jgi:protein gp37
MSAVTKIEWADGTWNPWIGCTKVSPGCKNCYAEVTTRARVLRKQGQETWGKGARRSRTSAGYWKQPGRWNEQPWICNGCGVAVRDPNDILDVTGECFHLSGFHRKRVFPSLCDWLDEEVPIEWLGDFLKVIQETPNIDWLLLTKRPQLFFKRLSAAGHRLYDDGFLDAALMVEWWIGAQWKSPANVWVGTSCEDQERADERVPELLKIPARVRFLSCEPLLGEIDLEDITTGAPDRPGGEHHLNCLSLEGDNPADDEEYHGALINWVIVGGESGPGARPCAVDWVRSLAAQCTTAGVAPFIKQLGAVAVKVTGLEHSENCNNDDCALSGAPGDCDGDIAYDRLQLKDPKGGDMSEWPQDLRVREMPKVDKV